MVIVRQMPLQRYGYKTIARIQEDALQSLVSVLIYDEFIVGFDQHESFAVYSQDEGVAVGPVPAIFNGEHGGTIEWVLHDAGEIQGFGSELRSTRAVLSVRLSNYRYLNRSLSEKCKVLGVLVLTQTSSPRVLLIRYGRYVSMLV